MVGLDVALQHRFSGFSLDAAFSAPRGVTALFGRSGSGKTTIVNAVAGLLRPESGRVSVNGQALVDTGRGVFLPPHRRHVGYVFQEGRLFPHMTVRQNLRYGAWFSREAQDGKAHEGEFAHIVEMLGIGPLLSRRPAALSGGEKQRVAIGRALLSRPRLLLMDEPLAALDEQRKAEIMPYLERIRDEATVPVLYVSHAIAEVARLATTVVVLSEGRVMRAGPTEAVLADPGTMPAIGLREAGSVLSGVVFRHHEDGLTEVRLSAGTILLPHVAAEPGSRIRMRIAARDVIVARKRPEAISALNILEGTVVGLRRGEGPGMAVQIRIGEEILLARITQRSAEALALAPGVPCHAVVKTVSVGRADIGPSG